MGIVWLQLNSLACSRVDREKLMTRWK